ncbi:MAG: ribose-5-phosphate isomerase RpiA [Pseudomonadota bacterium]|nr:ribose-5-phosphate isomerase RpiA [Pseudomonadota bacterium]
MNNLEESKKAVAKKAAKDVMNETIIGVGTGSTVNYFIEALAKLPHQIECTVASSDATKNKLEEFGFYIDDLNTVSNFDLYVDGADEATRFGYLIKGGGGALTREKILASVTKKFICIIDETKLVDCLGEFPLPIEVIPTARSAVARKVVELGGIPEWRSNFTTDNHNWILDVKGLDLTNSYDLESELNNIPGVVTNGIFARNKADMLYIGSNQGVEILKC